MEKQRWEESERRRAEERRSESEERKSEKKEDAGARKGRKIAKHCVLPLICGSGASKSRLAKAAGAEPSGQMRDEKLHAVVARSTCWSQNLQNTLTSEVEMSKQGTPLWRETQLEAKMYKTHQVRTTFGSSNVEKVHAVVARSTFLQLSCFTLHYTRLDYTTQPNITLHCTHYTATNATATTLH